MWTYDEREVWDEMKWIYVLIIFWRYKLHPHQFQLYWSYASFFFHLHLSLSLTCIHSPHRHTSHCIRFVNCSWWCCRVVAMRERRGEGGEDGAFRLPAQNLLYWAWLSTNGMPRHPLSMIPMRCSHESMGWHLPGFCDAKFLAKFWIDVAGQRIAQG